MTQIQSLSAFVGGMLANTQSSFSETTTFNCFLVTYSDLDADADADTNLMAKCLTISFLALLSTTALILAPLITANNQPGCLRDFWNHDLNFQNFIHNCHLSALEIASITLGIVALIALSLGSIFVIRRSRQIHQLTATKPIRRRAQIWQRKPKRRPKFQPLGTPAQNSAFPDPMFPQPAMTAV
ncbi:hypothetical protein O181_101217 [Austropuccinia psidii MF-1]|uniref:Uncharacterized protein n=1 Tax=Austropuccinia psidii MF-1 TaxID=1389203 RepID=A0A9Q3PIA8_9BASI|nr:hypothetical protein [Austropuccinia psidii MF-1]